MTEAIHQPIHECDVDGYILKNFFSQIMSFVSNIYRN